MKNILVLISTLISIAAFADGGSTPNCPVLRKGTIHFTLYKDSWVQDQGNWKSTHQIACDQTLELKVTGEIEGQNCNPSVPQSFDCNITLNKVPTRVSIGGVAQVGPFNGNPLAKIFYASAITSGQDGKIRSTSLVTKDLGLKDATLYIPVDQPLLPNPAIMPDDISLAVTFEDPNAL